MRLASERRTTPASIRSSRPSGLVARGLNRWLADVDPGGDEVARLRRRPHGHRFDPATLPMSEHDEARDLQDLDAKFQRSARSVMSRVGTVLRHERGDVADDEQFPRDG